MKLKRFKDRPIGQSVTEWAEMAERVIESFVQKNKDLQATVDPVPQELKPLVCQVIRQRIDSQYKQFMLWGESATTLRVYADTLPPDERHIKIEALKEIELERSKCGDTLEKLIHLNNKLAEADWAV